MFLPLSLFLIVTNSGMVKLFLFQTQRELGVCVYAECMLQIIKVTDEVVFLPKNVISCAKTRC